MILCVKMINKRSISNWNYIKMLQLIIYANLCIDYAYSGHLDMPYNSIVPSDNNSY